jgi:hypothetical protein
MVVVDPECAFVNRRKKNRASDQRMTSAKRS